MTSAVHDFAIRSSSLRSTCAGDKLERRFQGHRQHRVLTCEASPINRDGPTAAFEKEGFGLFGHGGTRVPTRRGEPSGRLDPRDARITSSNREEHRTRLVAAVTAHESNISTEERLDDKQREK